MKKILGIFLLTALVLLPGRSSASYGKSTLEGSSENQKEVFSATSTITGQRESNRQHVKQITEEPYNNNFDAVLADLTKQDGGQHGNVAGSNVGLAGYGSEGTEADYESRLREEHSSRSEVGGRKSAYGSASTASSSGYGSTSTGNYDYGSVGPQAGYAPKIRDELASDSGIGDLRSGYGSSSSSTSSTGYGSASSGNAGYGSSGTPIYDYGSVGPQAGYAPIVRDNESSGRKSGYGVPTSSGYGSSASASSSSSSASGYGTGASNTGYGAVPSNTGYGAVPPKTGYGTIPPTTGYGANVGLRNSIGLNEDNNNGGITYDSQTDLHEGGASIGGGHSYGHSGDNGSGSGSSGGYINRTPNGVSTGYSSHSESSSGYPSPTQSGPPYPYPQPSQNIPGYYPAPPPRAYAPRPQPPYQFPSNHPHYQQPQHDPLYHQQPFQHDPLFHQQHDPLYHQQHPIQQYPVPYPHQPQPGYGRLDHRLKTNTEYKEDGHHTGSFNALHGGAAGNNGCGYGSGFCGGYNGAFNRPGI